MPSPRERRRKIMARQGRRRKKSLILRINSSRIKAFVAIVKRPQEFGGVFQSGEKVLRVHVDSTNRRELLTILRKYSEERHMLKENGFAGMYGDTSNPQIINAFTKMFEARQMTPPPEAIIEARKYYEQKVRLRGYPPEYLETPVKRLCVRF